MTSMRDAMSAAKAQAVSSYNTLKQVRKDLGLPFSTAQSGEGYADEGAWPEDYEQQAVDIFAMAKIFEGGVNDVLAGKRKLQWDEKLDDFAIEGFASDPTRIQYAANGTPTLVNASGTPTHASGQVGIAPIVLAVGGLSLVSGIALGVLIIQGFKTIEIVSKQKTQRSLAETAGKNADLVKEGKATPAEAVALNNSIYKGASELAKTTGEAEKREKETSDIASAVKTLAWVGLGVGVLYVVAQVLKGGALGMPALAGARDNPDYTQFRSSYLPAALRDVPPFTPSGTDLEVWTWEETRRDGTPLYVAIAFAGKAGKPLWHYSFRNPASRLAEIEKSIAGRKAHLKWREERTGARRDFKHTLKVGDVLYTSYGYDETHISFYQVIETKGKSVVVCKIGKKVAREGRTYDEVVPVPGECRGKPETKRVGEGNSVKIDDHYAGVWKGTPLHETALGWGH